MKTKQTLYDGSIIEVDGIEFKISIVHDDLTGPPWEECDGHGPVSDWTCRDKRPGEMLLAEDHGWKRFYDFQSAVKIARRDGWNVAPFPVWKTRGEQAAAAAYADYEYLARWCRNDWEYVTLTVTALDEDGDILDFVSAGLGGVEYDPRDTSHVAEMAEMLAHQVIAEHQGMFSKPYYVDESDVDESDFALAA
jgi:hypothetical protein